MTTHLDSISIENIHNQLLFSLNIISTLKTRLKEELDNGDFYSSDAPKELVTKLGELIDVIEAHLEWDYHEASLQLEESLDQVDLKRLQRRIKSATSISVMLIENLKYINGAQASYNPWRLIGLMERLCHNLVPNSRLISCPAWEYNFTYYSITNIFKRLSAFANLSDSSLRNGIDSVIKDIPNYFSLSFPCNAPNDTLFLAIWSHEIGHFIDNIRGEIQTKDSQKYLSSEVLKGLSISITKQEILDITKIDLDNFSDEDLSYNLLIPIQRIFQGWAKEIFADLIAIRLFGPSAGFAIVEVLRNITDDFWRVTDTSHPPVILRVKVIWETINKWNAENESWLKDLPEEILCKVKEELNIIESIASEEIKYPKDVIENEKIPLDYKLKSLIDYFVFQKFIEVVDKISGEIDKIQEGNRDLFFSPTDIKIITSMIQNLQNNIPPILDLDDFLELTEESRINRAISLVLNAGWFYWLSCRKFESRPNMEKYYEKEDEFKQINNMVAKSCEIIESQLWFYTRARSNNSAIFPEEPKVNNQVSIINNENKYGSLSKNAIRNRLFSDCNDEKIWILPLLDKDSQIDVSSVDIRLGNEFIILKLPVVTKLDPADLNIRTRTTQYQSKILVPFGEPFVLHPGQFVLGSTLEYIGLPNDIMALVVGRSSWGRLGLVIATASKVDPGFKGCITLELTNLGNIPIFLYPCMRIGQLIFSYVE